MECPNCGHVVSEGSEICLNCGCKFNDDNFLEKYELNLPNHGADTAGQQPGPEPVKEEPKPEPEPVKTEPVKQESVRSEPEPSPVEEKPSRKPKKRKSNDVGICKKGLVLAVILIVVGIVMINVPSYQTHTDDTPYALVTFTVSNLEDESVNMTLSDGSDTYLSYDNMPSDYYRYTVNYAMVKLDGNSGTFTFTAKGIGTSTGTTYTDSETLTLYAGQEYRVYLEL